MKALKTKVILSGIVLVFAFIATIGTTFAWFTVSQTASVESLDLTISAEDNLLIRVDQGYTWAADEAELRTVGNYQTSLLKSDITGTTQYADFDTWAISPSTVFQTGYASIDGKTLNILEGVEDYDRSLTGADSNATNGQYIELKFWVYSQSNDPQDIQLGDNVSITTTETDPELAEVVNAVRFSVWAQDFANTTETDAYIFGNDTDFGFEFLENNAGYSSSATGSDDADFNDLFNRQTPLINDPDGVTDPAELNSSNVTNASQMKNLNDESTTPTNLFTLQSETPTLVTILIFVEGWDAETTNGIITAPFEILIEFKFAA